MYRAMFAEGIELHNDGQRSFVESVRNIEKLGYGGEEVDGLLP